MFFDELYVLTFLHPVSLRIFSVSTSVAQGEAIFIYCSIVHSSPGYSKYTESCMHGLFVALRDGSFPSAVGIPTVHPIPKNRVLSVGGAPTTILVVLTHLGTGRNFLLNTARFKWKR